MAGTDERKYGIRELVQASGVSRRTVRYYVQRGLIPPPEGAGRGHYYRPEHLSKLLAIKELQGRGLPLEQIRSRLAGGAENTPPADRVEPEIEPEIELATRIHVAPGVELLLSHRAGAPRPAQVRALAEAAVRILAKGGAR